MAVGAGAVGNWAPNIVQEKKDALRQMLAQSKREIEDQIGNRMIPYVTCKGLKVTTPTLQGRQVKYIHVDLFTDTVFGEFFASFWIAFYAANPRDVESFRPVDRTDLGTRILRDITPRNTDWNKRRAVIHDKCTAVAFQITETLSFLKFDFILGRPTESISFETAEGALNIVFPLLANAAPIIALT